jgi:hypothetical protein
MLGINPMIISYAIKGKLDEIINGQIPEGFKLVEKSENKIILTASELLADPEIKINKIDFRIEYKNIKIVLSHE